MLDSGLRAGVSAQIFALAFNWPEPLFLRRALVQ